MRIMRTLTLTTVIACLLVVPAVAQNSTPQVIKVQGYLSDKSGGAPVPANGTFSMTFGLYDSDTAGLLVASVGPLSVEVTEGLYEVELQFLATAFESSERFIEIMVDPDGAGPAPPETLSPRIRVVSAPFAYVAEKLDGFEGTDLNQSGEVTTLQGDVTGLQGQVATVAGDVAAHEVAPDAHSMYVKKVGDNMSGTLTITPLSGHALALHSQEAFSPALRVSGENARVFFSLNSASGASEAGLEVYLDGVRKGRLYYSKLNGNLYFTNDNGDFLVLTADGNFGIDTISPAAKFDVNGTTRTRVLEITGGADLAEPFEVSTTASIPKGAVLVLDEEAPGRLKLSDVSYDTRVAGVVSGAGGITPGLTLSQDGITAGQVSVAMAGRVYAQATAANGSVRPGDLLTTSNLPGRAMKATDVGRSHGAILGKAMTGLEEGEGLVLVLVNLH